LTYWENGVQRYCIKELHRIQEISPTELWKKLVA